MTNKIALRLMSNFVFGLCLWDYIVWGICPKTLILLTTAILLMVASDFIDC